MPAGEGTAPRAPARVAAPDATLQDPTHPGAAGPEDDTSELFPGRDPHGRATWGLAEGAVLAPGRTVLRPLGGGSRFEVFLVWDERRLALTVAKVLRPDRAADRTALHDLHREAHALTRLAHPVLLRGFEDAVDAAPPHVLVEHLEGPSLGSLLREGQALGLEQLLPLALHVAAALHYMAAEQWVHLDVKPDNVIMGVPPRLIDLSVARPLPEARRLPAPVGTDGYMAPEQCDPARGAVGPAADVWGLGATLHHAIAGVRPFPRSEQDARSPDPERRWPQLVRAPSPLPARVPGALRELIAAALAPDPADRPAAAALAAGLEPLVTALSRPRGRRVL
jgi:serine/threonine protein kinase